MNPKLWIEVILVILGTILLVIAQLQQVPKQWGNIMLLMGVGMFMLGFFLEEVIQFFKTFKKNKQ